ncbi:uncharacterized protein LOC123470468 [Daphnia magna]|nr:uncharacterized protein LOC123470468 [Daphnia magna]
MGSKGEEYFGLLEIGKSYMLKNGVVIILNSKGGVPDMVYKFVPLKSIASINDGQVIDTFGYVCDIGGMTTSVVHESFGDNMLVNMTIGCTNETRLLISGMGFRRGHWFGRSGIQEDSIVAIKGVKIERRVKELLPEAHAIWIMKQGDSSEQVGECNAGEVTSKVEEGSG